MRVGMGYDVHKLVEGRDLILGGVKIPYEKGLLGHSDADVLLHAIMDALLGAAALGDIGKHFPDTDPVYKGASSIRLLEEVGRMIDEKLYVIGNIVATIIAQRPKMAPHIEQMRKNVAEALHIEVDQVNIKATTEEGLGFTGTGEGISSQAIASLDTIGFYAVINGLALTLPYTAYMKIAKKEHVYPLVPFLTVGYIITLIILIIQGQHISWLL